VQFLAADLNQDPAAIDVPSNAGLIHLAWHGLPNYSSLFHLEENLPHSYRFVKSLVMRGVRQVLVAGTSFEYGLQSGAIPSTADTRPNNPYAIAKDSLRRHLECLTAEHPFCLQWARLFYLHGEGQNPKSVLSQLDAAIDNHESTFRMSGGEQLRDYLPIAAAAAQIVALYERAQPGISNICSGNPISVRRLVEQRIAQRGATIKLHLGYYPYPDHEPLAFWGIREVADTES
jgi:dTDP-6-deoxy-L-talose 4-dehydrogenase (NAD+)